MDKVLPYNFKNNVFLSNSQLTFIEKIHCTFSEQAASTLSSFLREKVNIVLVQTEQIPLSLFIRSHSMPSCYSFLTISSLSKQSILTISPELSHTIVAQLLGSDAQHYSKPFTPLEFALLRQFMKAFLQSLQKTWQPIVDFTTHINKIGTDLSKVERMQKISKFVVLTFKMSLLETSGLISLLLPCESLYSIRTVFSEENQISQSINLQHIEVSLKAVLGSSNLSSQELRNLKNGDILKLDQRLSQPISMLVENNEAFRGYPGLSYKNKGVTLYARS